MSASCDPGTGGARCVHSAHPCNKVSLKAWHRQGRSPARASASSVHICARLASGRDVGRWRPFRFSPARDHPDTDRPSGSNGVRSARCYMNCHAIAPSRMAMTSRSHFVCARPGLLPLSGVRPQLSCGCMLSCRLIPRNPVLWERRGRDGKVSCNSRGPSRAASDVAYFCSVRVTS